MRRKLLYLLLSFFPLALAAQSLEIIHGDKALKPGDEITLYTDDIFEPLYLDDLSVVNLTHRQMEVLCVREMISEVYETNNSFSWGILKESDDPYSAMPVELKAGEYSNEFKAEYAPSGNYGTTKVRYIFYDKNNAVDRVDVIVNYKSASGSNSLEKIKQVSLSPAYPNPAQNVVHFDYSMPQRFQESKIVMYNLFGAIVKEIEITEITGSLKTNTSDLTEGIYFYSLMINNESILTQKLVIKH